ncbi:hypothetical protein Q765_05410 [Flavobacterium rivuli WB 3.3-2 = DSM 21788]|uniref:Secretion system C-terminal sorting domain-containing protein n=1 Tax=Flavobacterium rivuli WB 3.3-2 = DSM 21788 TaxID=1121895 RepID=A0A0A2M7Z2_9FLAO|nr:T9SS sorting signal type C domain-containing protein [Flavobacterium rivuli]KGO87573.1 hypothetical protein Q765_05410 [Flavobacterium rivuli WB 3.3-2 = DSM 21788]
MNNKITFLIALLFSLIFNAAYAQDGANDPTFNPTDTGYGNGADGYITSASVQSDGKIIIAGSFSHYSTQDRKCIARVNTDKTLDTSFNVGTGANEIVSTTAILSDGKILIGGNFTNYNGFAVNKIVRINTDGSLDTTFNAPGIGLQNDISKLIVQPDGKIVVIENSSYFDPVLTSKIVRLNADGSTDNTFVPGIAIGISLRNMAVQPDGKIIVVGDFSLFNDEPHNKVVRLNSDGTLDTAFNPTYAGEYPSAVAVLNNGKFYIGGVAYRVDNILVSGIQRYNEDGSTDATFTTDANTNPLYVVDILTLPNDKIITVGGVLSRLNADGSTDNSFVNGGFDYGSANALARTPDGKLVITGDFAAYNGYTESYIVKINEDGSNDTSFTLGNGTGADNGITATVSQADGGILIMGYFKHYNGVARNGFARITEDGILDETFNPIIGANEKVHATASAPDGKVYIQGIFEISGGVTVNALRRLNADGTLDTSFDTGLGFTSRYGPLDSSMVLEIQPDGKLLVAGHILSYNGVSAGQVIRINTDGSLDTSFNMSVVSVHDERNIRFIKVLPEEGKIYVVGESTNGAVQNTVTRLNSNGSQDNSFTPITSESLRNIEAFTIQPDGKILIGGLNIEDAVSNMFLRFNSDGTPDIVFFDGLSNYVQLICPQQDGKIILTGMFDNGPDRPKNMIRINNDGTLDDTFVTQSYYINDIRGIVQQEDKLVIAGYFTTYGSAGRNRIARIMSSGSMGTNTPEAVNNNVIAYRNNDALQITSSNQVIKSVQVYDLAGRLLSDDNNVNAINTSIEDLAPARKILIVNIKLADGTSVSKKLYY